MTYQEHLDSLYDIYTRLFQAHVDVVNEETIDLENRQGFIDDIAVVGAYRQQQKALTEFQDFQIFCKENNIDMNSEMLTRNLITFNETADIIMKLLYNQKDGLVLVHYSLNNISVKISTDELLMLKRMIENRGLGIFMPAGRNDFRAKISEKGIEFCETSSFADPEMTIIVKE